MNRRQFLLNGSMAATVALSSPTLFAQEAAPEPFRRIGPNHEDKNKILAFFQFSCPACRASHEMLHRWGSTVPSPMTFEFVPVIYPDLSVIASARAWLAASLLDAASLRAFETAAYKAIQSGGLDPVKPATWSVVARDAGIHHAAYAAAWARITKDSLEPLAHVFFRNQVQATPSITIGGQYLVTPDNANGHEGIFIQLLNGITSAVIEGRTL